MDLKFTINCFYSINKFMLSIPDLYQASLNNSKGGLQGYHVHKKYIDAAKIKQQKLQQSKNKSFSSDKPVIAGKKTTFIDDAQKKSKKLPAPGQYQPKQMLSQSKTAQVVIVYPDRSTIFGQMEKQAKKKNYPASNKYSKVVIDIDKVKLKPNLSAAESPTYLQASMRNSLGYPGVGDYNVSIDIFDKKGGKISIPSKIKSRSQTQTKLPPVGTYDPQPAQYSLFSSKSSKKLKSTFDKSLRSKNKMSKQKNIPYYNIQSDWGFQKHKKKDILSKVSTHVHRSVYY